MADGGGGSRRADRGPTRKSSVGRSKKVPADRAVPAKRRAARPIPMDAAVTERYDDAAAAEFYADEKNLVPAGPMIWRKAPRRPMSGHVPVRFDDATIAAVKTRAEVAGMTVSAWIRHVIARELAAGSGDAADWDKVQVVRVPAGTQRLAIEIEGS